MTPLTAWRTSRAVSTIILISSGRDSFSKHTLDQTLKKVQASKDIAIYTVSTGKALLNYARDTWFDEISVRHYRIQLQHDVFFRLITR